MQYNDKTAEGHGNLKEVCKENYTIIKQSGKAHSLEIDCKQKENY